MTAFLQPSVTMIRDASQPCAACGTTILATFNDVVLETAHTVPNAPDVMQLILLQTNIVAVGHREPAVGYRIHEHNVAEAVAAGEPAAGPSPRLADLEHEYRVALDHERDATADAAEATRRVAEMTNARRVAAGRLRAAINEIGIGTIPESGEVGIPDD